MSSSLSGLPPISTYLSIIKNEPAQVAQMVKTDPGLQRTVSSFETDTVSITSPAALLAAKNQDALQVVLGAYNMSGSSTETGLLNKLLTQDPSVSGSLVQSLGDPDDLNFVKAMTDRATISFGFGDPTTNSFTSGGSAASSISFQNLAWASANTSLTAASPAQTFSYVLDDGTAAASIATALTTALQSSGTTADPVTASYSVSSTGTIEGSAGAPAVTTSKDSAGNTIYSLALATNAAGAAIRLATVVAVQAPAPLAGAATPQQITAAAGTALMSTALGAAGFNIAANGAGGFNIVNPISNGPLSLTQQSYSTYAATSSAAISTTQNVLPLGAAGKTLSAGQILSSGGNTIGTIQSVDAAGDVTLTAASALQLAAGTRIDVAIGASVSNIGTQMTATAALDTTGTILPLGLAAAGMRPGQTITDGGSVVGIVKSVDGAGNVTLQASAAVTVAAGDTLGILPQVGDSQTPALQDAANVKTILSQYETNQYETQEGQEVPGMTDALYFTRTAPAITSITQLMSDTTLLNVVTTNLGLSDTYGELPYDQQVTLLTSKVNLSTFSNPTSLQHYVEQFLALTGENAASGGSAPDPASILLSGGTSSSGDSDPADALMAALYPGSSGTNSNGLGGILGALYA